ncbi:hypothetical protein RB195_015860 [Necator americanus]
MNVSKRIVSRIREEKVRKTAELATKAQEQYNDSDVMKCAPMRTTLRVCDEASLCLQQIAIHWLSLLTSSVLFGALLGTFNSSLEQTNIKRQQFVVSRKGLRDRLALGPEKSMISPINSR